MSVLGTIVDTVLKLNPVTQGGNYSFPEDLNSSYYLMFNFCAYTRQDLNSIGTAPIVAQVRLPIPASLTDSYGVNYSEEELSTGIAAASGAALGGDLGSLAGIGVAGALSSMANATKLGRAAIGAGGPVVSALSGYSLNPFLTVMFKSPQYKQYQFGWRLFPKNNAESAKIQSITNLIRYHMLPDRSGGFGGAILSWPSLVRCQIIAKGSELYPFKYGVIKDLSVNYAPDGAPSFFKDGKPTAVDIKLTIQEVEYFLKSNMGSSS
jgi:hypothetical protein